MVDDIYSTDTPKALTAALPAAVATATPTTRHLADHSLSPNTRDAYARALRQFDAWRGPEAATDTTLATYLGWLFERGRAPGHGRARGRRRHLPRHAGRDHGSRAPDRARAGRVSGATAPTGAGARPRR